MPDEKCFSCNILYMKSSSNQWVVLWAATIEGKRAPRTPFAAFEELKRRANWAAWR